MISFPPGTEMFHFPGFAPSAVFIPAAVTGRCSRRVAPFRHLRIIGCLAPPRSFSQLTASFFAFRRQGIRLVRLITCLKKTSFLALFNCQSAAGFPARIHSGSKQPASLGIYPLIMVGLERLELSTSRLSGVRSNHLSYRPKLGSLQMKSDSGFFS